MHWIVSGATRGIGEALARALAARAAPGDRVVAIGRDGARLAALARDLGDVIAPRALDLADLDATEALGEALAETTPPGAVLVHNAGLWPSRRERAARGLERAFLVNAVAPLVLQAPLLRAGRLARVLVVSAGLLVKGRFDAARTPTGADFSAFRTYCSTKLAGAAAMREVARASPEVDFAVVHPGVVRTDLGARPGVLGALLRLVKRRWEAPETCAARLVGLLERARWEESPGEAAWFFEAGRQAWPAEVARDAEEVRRALAPWLQPVVASDRHQGVGPSS